MDAAGMTGDRRQATIIMYLRRKGFAWEDIIKITGILICTFNMFLNFMELNNFEVI